MMATGYNFDDSLLHMWGGRQTSEEARQTALIESSPATNRHDIGRDYLPLPVSPLLRPITTTNRLGNQLQPNNTTTNYNCSRNMGSNTSNNYEDQKIKSKKAKKSVRFEAELTCYGLGATHQGSDLSPEEKQLLWYRSRDFDHFKRLAAADAGVKIVRCDDGARSGSFVMVGDFDQPLNKQNNDSAVKPSYHNENEYKDARSPNGEAVCRRGLGYHFSRSRKRGRAVARSAVAAWQKTLKNDAAGSVNNGEKTRLMLALVSAKCSRAAREEAQWRGDVDRRVAYPEMKAAPAVAQVSLSGRSERRNGASAESSMGNKRHVTAEFDAVGHSKNKRRRTSSGGCRDNVGGALSPSTMGEISGMLRTAV